MKLKPIGRFILFLSLFYSCNKTDMEILNKTITQLTSIEQIEYKVINEDYDKANNENRKDTATCYFDFSSKDTLIGTKYHFTSSLGEQVFDGNKEFTSLNEQEIILYNDKPTKRRVTSSIFMHNSLFALRKVLPEIINDSTITISRLQDTTISSKECYKFKILMPGKYIDMGGVLTEIQTDEEEIPTLEYELSILKENYLPIQFGNIQPKGNGYSITTYSNYQQKIIKNDSIWEYSRFPKGYLRTTPEDYFQRQRNKNQQKVGSKAIDWELPMVEGDSVRLSKIDKKLILLEFWFPYCTGCVQATPILNEIQSKYKDKGLSIYGIEFTEKPAEALLEYSKKQQIDIPTLYNGKDISKEYGVYAAPTFFLIDENLEIIYTSAGLNKEELINEIERKI